MRENQKDAFKKKVFTCLLGFIDSTEYYVFKKMLTIVLELLFPSIICQTMVS